MHVAGVTPFVGVWIETELYKYNYQFRAVTPFVGVWIETAECLSLANAYKSHPSWVCGLKLNFLGHNIVKTKVTPFVGVWIETCNNRF